MRIRRRVLPLDVEMLALSRLPRSPAFATVVAFIRRSCDDFPRHAADEVRQALERRAPMESGCSTRLTTPDWKEAKSQTDIYLVSIPHGVSSTKQLTFTKEKNDRRVTSFT